MNAKATVLWLTYLTLKPSKQRTQRRQAKEQLARWSKRQIACKDSVEFGMVKYFGGVYLEQVY